MSWKEQASDTGRGYYTLATEDTGNVPIRLFLTPALHAQSCTASTDFDASLPAWNTPLDRVVSLHARDISLRDALDRLSSDARVKLSRSRVECKRRRIAHTGGERRVA